MGFALTNKIMTIPTTWPAVFTSTSLAQFPSTTTTTSTSVSFFHQEFADYTTTGMVPLSTQVQAGSVGDFRVAHNQYRALVYFKSFTPATATATSTGAALPITTVGPLMTLECATSTGYAPLYTIDWRYLPTGQSTALYATSTGSLALGGPTAYLWGQVPISGGCQFARVNFYATGGAAFNSSSTQLDCIIEGI